MPIAKATSHLGQVEGEDQIIGFRDCDENAKSGGGGGGTKIDDGKGFFNVILVNHREKDGR